jgi:hypothetical protein
MPVILFVLRVLRFVVVIIWTWGISSLFVLCVSYVMIVTEGKNKSQRTYNSARDATAYRISEILQSNGSPNLPCLNAKRKGTKVKREWNHVTEMDLLKSVKCSKEIR